MERCYCDQYREEITIGNDRRPLFAMAGGLKDAVSPPAGPGQSSGGGAEGEAPGRSEKPAIYSTKIDRSQQVCIE